jgi:hypothetical protein
MFSKAWSYEISNQIIRPHRTMQFYNVKKSSHGLSVAVVCSGLRPKVI